MSAGKFTNSKYQANNGDIYGVRVQEETLALSINSVANAAPTGPVSAGLKARVSGGNRAYGLKCRGAYFRFTATPPTGYLEGGTIYLPLLTSDIYDEAQTPGATGTYLGVAVEVVGTSPERKK